MGRDARCACLAEERLSWVIKTSRHAAGALHAVVIVAIARRNHRHTAFDGL